MILRFFVSYKGLNRDIFIDEKLPIHFKVISFFLTLIPFTLVTGPFLPDLFLTIIAAYFLVISIIFRLKDYYKTKLVYAFVLFYFCILLRGIFSDYPYESLLGFNGPIFYFRYLFFVLGIQYLITLNSNLIKIFSLNLAIVLTFTILDGYLQWIVGSNVFGFQSPSARVTGIFNNEEILGHFLSRTVPFSLGLLIYIYGSSKKLIFLYIILLVISEILIFISNDRAGFLKIFQFTLLLIFLSNNFKIVRLVSFGVSIFFIALIISNSDNSKERYQGTLSDVSSTTIPYMPWTPHHDKQFKIAIDMFKENPIFGKGPQTFRILCMKNLIYKDGCTNHPHNYYLQIAGELGFWGLLITTLIIISILTKGMLYLKNSKSNEYNIKILMPFFIIFVLEIFPLKTTGSFFTTANATFLFIILSFVVGLINKNKIT